MGKNLNKLVSKAVLTSMVATTVVNYNPIIASATAYEGTQNSTVTAENVSNKKSISVKAYYKVGTDAEGTTTQKYVDASFVLGSSFVAPSIPTAGKTIKDKDTAAESTFGEAALVNYFGEADQDAITLSDSTGAAVVTKQFIGWGVKITNGGSSTYQVVKPGDKIDQTGITTDTEISIIALYGQQRKIRLQEGDNYRTLYVGQADKIDAPSSDYSDEKGDVFKYWSKDDTATSYGDTGYEVNNTTFGDITLVDKITVGSEDLALKAQVGTPHTVKFVDVSGNELKTYTVGEGGKMVAPEASVAPTIKGMTFKGWKGATSVAAGDVLTINADATYTATYATTVTVTFVDPVTNKTINTVDLAQGDTINTSDYDVPTHEGLASAGWSVSNGATINANTTVKAQYTSEVTVKINNTGVNLTSVNVKIDDGAAATNGSATATVPYGSKLSISKADLETTIGASYVCSGFTNSDVKLSSDNAYYEFTPTKNTTLVAKTAVAVTVTLATKLGMGEEFIDANGDDVTATYTGGAKFAQGETITLPTVIAKDGYTFVGWSGATKNSDGNYVYKVNSDATLNPIFTTKLTFKDTDGSVILEKDLELNNDNSYEIAIGAASIAVKDIPKHEGKLFSEWIEATASGVNFAINLNGDAYVSDAAISAPTTFVAKYVNAQTVKFYDPISKSVLKEELVPVSTAITVPDETEYSGLTFVKWDVDVSTGITKDTTVNAVYAAKVTFKDVDGSLMALDDKAGSGVTTDSEGNVPKKLNGTSNDFEDATKTDTEQYVQYGKAAIAPYAPAKDGNLVFKGWDTDFSNITKDTVVTAQYAPEVDVKIAPATGTTPIGVEMSENDTDRDIYGNITSTAALTGIVTIAVGSGGNVILPVPTATVLGKTFAYYEDGDGNKYYAGDTLTNVTTSLSLTPVYASAKTVKFVGLDGSVISTVEVGEGGKVIAPDAEDMVIEGLNFAGWDKSLEDITADTTITAKYTATVTYLDKDGKVYATKDVEYGKAAPSVTGPAREGLTFKSWSTTGDLSNVTKPTTATPNYVAKVTFKDEQGNVLGDVLEVAEGGTVAAPNYAAPEGYNFVGWDKSLENIASDTTITAKVERKAGVFIVTFKDVDGTVIGEVAVNEGEAAKAPEAPAKEGKVFAGWDRSLDSIKSDLEVYAKYNAKTFKVTVDGVEQTVEYGKDVVLPANPTKEGYTFKGWEGQTTGITADGTVTAKFEKNPETPGEKPGEKPGETPGEDTGDGANAGAFAGMFAMAVGALAGIFRRKKDNE